MKIKTVEQIKQWLIEEIKHNEPVVNGTEETSDDSYDIHLGRMECADSLLRLLKGNNHD